MTPNSSSAFEVPTGDRADHRRVGAILRRNGALLLALPILGATMGATFGLGTAERHEATVQLALNQESGNRFLSEATRFDNETIVDAHVAMIRSDATATEALRLFRSGEIDLDPDLNNGNRLTVDWLREHTVAATPQRGGLIEITAWAPGASSAEALADGLAQAHVNLRREALRDDLTTLAAGFEEEADATRSELQRLASTSTGADSNAEAIRANSLALEKLVSDAGMARVDAGLAQGGVVILERATADDAAVGADPVRTASVTAIVALFLAAVLAATRERLWGTVASPGEAEALSGMAVLGEVPKLKGDGLLTMTDLGGTEHQIVKGVVDWVSALHKAGEPATGVMRRLAVVGIGPRGVAAPLAHNIAVCLAQRGPVTLVANADIESSGLSGPTWLKLADDASNSMAAARTQGVDVAVASLGAWEDLQIIAGGWNDPFMKQPLDPAGTDALLNALGGPSSQLVLEVDNLRASPAAALAACTADAVLVVVTLDRSRPDELRATIDLLQSYGAPVAGLVVQHRSRYQPVPWSALVHYPILVAPEPDTEPLAAAAAPIA